MIVEIKTKICTKCGVEKDVTAFGKAKHGKYGVRSVCRECRSVATDDNKKKRIERDNLFKQGLKRCPDCHEVKSLDKFSFTKRKGKNIINSICLKCSLIRTTIYYNKHLKSSRIKLDESTLKEHRRISSRLYNATHPEARRKLAFEYKERNNQRIKEKKQLDINFRIKCSLKTRFWQSIKLQKAVKQCKFDQYIGCAIDELRIYIESLWEVGMSWDNHTLNGWHIDHIIPCKAFDLTNSIHQKACFNWRNLRPMWGKPNARKGANYKQEDFDRYMAEFFSLENRKVA